MHRYLQLKNGLQIGPTNLITHAKNMMNSASSVIFPLKLNCYFCSATSCKVSTTHQMNMEDEIVLENKADQNILDGY